MQERSSVQQSRDKWAAANPRKKQEINARWKANNKDKVFGYHLQRKYGISLEQYDLMYGYSQGQCGICKATIAHGLEPDVKVGLKACVDHCHTTGKVRGLLCHYCNRSLAFLEAHKDAALTYLTKETP